MAATPLYDSEDKKEADERKEIEVEAKKLYEFFKDYNDLLMDKKYYSHDKFQKRYKNYLRERADDEEERNTEMKEIEFLREKLEDDGELDPDGCIEKVIKEADQVWQPVVKPVERKDKKKDRKDKKRAKKSRTHMLKRTAESEVQGWNKRKNSPKPSEIELFRHGSGLVGSRGRISRKKRFFEKVGSKT